MARKLLAILLVLVVSLTMLTACQQKTETPVATASTDATETDQASTPAQEDKPITLELYTHTQEVFDLTFAKLVDEYHSEFPNVTVNYNQIPMDTFATQLALIFSTKQNLDLINIHDRYLGSYLDFLAPAPDWVVEDMKENAPASYAAGQINGKIYGYLLPDVNMLFVNKTLLAENGLDYPTTWEDLQKIDAALTKTVEKDGAQIQQYGVDFYVGAGQFVFTSAIWKNIYESIGGTFYQEDGSIQINNDLGIKATEIYADLSHPEESMFDSFGGGRTAVSLGAKWTVGYYRSVGVEGLDFDVTAMPISTNGEPLAQGYFQVMCVPNYISEEQQEAAWKFNAWLHNDANNLTLETVGGIGDWRTSTMETVAGEDEVMQHAYAQSQYATEPIVDPQWGEIERIIGENFDKVIAGELTAAEAMAAAQAELDAMD